MDRAGYCFGSVLGQAQFDNSDCVGKSVSLSGYWQNIVGQIQALERQHQCRVNTTQPVLELGDHWIRRQLVHLPLRDDFESACIGFIGAPVPLYAGADLSNAVIGTIDPGLIVSFAHYPLGNWSYVTTYREGEWEYPVSGGWTAFTFKEANCAQWAG